MNFVQQVASVGSGVLVGFSLGMVGGGGSILATPLMVYLIGVANPHVAIGTSAVVVAINAAIGLTAHARSRNVNWQFGLSFAAAGVMGSLTGSTLGKLINGERLLILFAMLMIVVGLFMLEQRKAPTQPMVVMNVSTASKLGGVGLSTGLLAGFFGIGGGFLVVPGLIGVTRMNIITAIGTSLIPVLAISLTTALNYGASGLIDWPLAFMFVTGGFVGSLLGAQAAKQLSQSRQRLNGIFVVLIFIIASYMMINGINKIL
ncbi:MAG: sulfite exporter TauE/SafE family protein [Pseudomonadota bacterium]